MIPTLSLIGMGYDGTLRSLAIRYSVLALLSRRKNAEFPDGATSLMLQKLMPSEGNCTKLNIYRVQKFLNGFKGSRTDVKYPKTICALDDLQHQNRTTSRKLKNFDSRKSASMFELLLEMNKARVHQNLQESFNIHQIRTKMSGKTS